MLRILAVGACIITINVILQALGNVLLVRRTNHHFLFENRSISNINIAKILTFSFLFITMMHFLHTFMWAICYYVNPATRVDFQSFSEALYFSLVTFTTLGYGDITLSSEWRLLSGIEAINGIMLIGWSTAMMYSIIQRINNVLKATTNQGVDK
ncbi:MAG: hypothetical protein COB60_03770 [Flavobacteriaceae bacterium]|nr:MAG: hypothetical protein COB60_03770 [Flavobacteriaceae bacterium]